MNNVDNMKLRSKKVLKVIGKIPASLVWLSYVIILIILLGLLLVFFLVPYPYGSGETIFQHFVQN